MTQKIILRDYQNDDVNRVRHAMRSIRRILLQEPTGAGKTVIASYMIQQAAAKGKRVYFICHRQELIEQTAKTFGKYGIQCGLVWANAPKLYHLPVQICSIDTLKNRLGEIIPPDLVIWDECLAGDTEIITDCGKIKITDVEKVGAKKVLSFDGVTTTMMRINGFRRVGKKDTLKICFDGTEIICTENHLIYTRTGWIEARKLITGMELLVNADAEDRLKKTKKAEEESLLSGISSAENLVTKNCFRDIIIKLKTRLFVNADAARRFNQKLHLSSTKNTEPLDLGNILQVTNGIKKGMYSLLVENNGMQLSEQFSETLHFCIQTLNQNIRDLRSIMEQNKQSGLNIKQNIFHQSISGLHTKNKKAMVTCGHLDALRALHSLMIFIVSHIKIEKSRLHKIYLERSEVLELHGGIVMTDRFNPDVTHTFTQKDFQSKRLIELLISLLKDTGTLQNNILRDISLLDCQLNLQKGCLKRSESTCQNFSSTKWVKITAIKKGCSEDVFDISVPGSQCFFANSVLTHNCHHVAAKSWSNVMQYWPDAWHIGLSATPTRLDGKGLDDHFDILLAGKQTSELIAMGNLSEYRFFQPSKVSTEGLHIKMGEYVKSEAEEVMDTNTIHGDIVRHYKEKALGMRAICFAVTVNHSKHIAEAFRAAGIMAVHLDGETPKKERRLAAKAFAQDQIQIITNVGLFGEGYDLAAQADMDVTVDCVIDAQPTNSLSWCLQKWGRALRPKADDSKAIILDHAGNCLRHGLPDDFREWSLDGFTKDQRKKTEEEAKINTRQCPECAAVHRPSNTCPECGYRYEVKGREINYQDGDLQEIDLDAMRNRQRRQPVIPQNAAHEAHILKAREEKDRLRRTLKNLVQGAKMHNMDYQYTTNEIMQMKPKELGAKIDEISRAMFDMQDFKSQGVK